MSAFFKPEDFVNDLNGIDFRAHKASTEANKKLSQIAISGFSQKHRGEWSFTERPMKGDTHNALLLNLSEIEPCAHEVHKVRYHSMDEYMIWRCQCGQEMEIGSFIPKERK